MNTWSVVIATHTADRWDSLVRAIDSVLDQNGRSPDVIVVVDHNPELAERIDQELGRKVRVGTNQEVKGLSGCRNTGARMARTPMVAFLDDDARADPKWLDHLDDALVQPAVGGVGGVAIPDWGNGSQPDWLPDEYLWVVGCHYKGHRTDSGPMRSPIGANMAFARADILAVGGFSPRFSSKPFNRCDDTEFAMRLTNRTGREIYFAPEAIVHHSVSPDRAKWRYFVSRCLLEGRAKAALSAEAGVGKPTPTEWAYVRNAIGPAAVKHVLRGLKGRLAEFTLAFNLLAGLVMTSLGFIHGSLLLKRHGAKSVPLGPPTIEVS